MYKEKLGGVTSSANHGDKVLYKKIWSDIQGRRGRRREDGVYGRVARWHMSCESMPFLTLVISATFFFPAIQY